MPFPYANIPPKPIEYKRGPTILDSMHPDSQLNRSRFRGFYNMFILFAVVFLFTKPILNKIENDEFFESGLFETFKNDYLLCLMVWPLFFFWSFTSYAIQLLILRGLPQPAVLVMQHSTQAGLFIFSTVLILSRDWCSTHAAFVILQACVHFMKMHSFTTVNRDYREEYLEATAENRTPATNYPNNINLREFVLFMWTPWLVYDQYPRKNSISFLYILQKSATCIIGVMTSYIIHTEYIIPHLEMGYKISFLEFMCVEMLPSITLILLMFFLTFENLTNVFAEITKLDYREFYEDFWNSTTFQEFNRKWNKPVHIFLYRHLYLELIIRFKISKNNAQLITFLFSALLHEFLFAIIFRVVEPYFLMFIIGQVPLIYLTKWMRGRKSGLYLFWFGLIIGPPLIVSCYLRFNSDVTNRFAK